MQGAALPSPAMETMTIETPGGPAEAWVARPQASEAVPGVLFVMDAIGLRPQIASMMERVAAWGFVVLAPNVFHRDGSIAETSPSGDLRVPGAREAFFASVSPRIGHLTSDLALADLASYLDTVRTLPGVAAGPVGVTGYCMGVRIAIRAAGAFPDAVGAVGGWHGGGLVTPEPDSPHLSLATATAAFAFGHATDDPSMPPEAVARLGAALTAAGVRHTNEVFPGPHGYTMADTSMYAPEADALHWQRLEALLRGTLATRR